MSSATIELYNALIEAGVDKDKAERAAKSVLSKEEARQSLATKADLAAMKSSIVQWVAGLLIGQIAIITGMMALMFNIYS